MNKRRQRGRFALRAALAVAALFTGISSSHLFGAEPLKTFYVAVDGNDAWSGQKSSASDNDGPFATLERAREAVREYRKTLPENACGDIVVSVGAGTYELQKTLEFDKEDGGFDQLFVRWVSDVDSPAVLVGGRYLNGAKKLGDAAILAKLKEDARQRVVSIDLESQGALDLGTPDNAPELFYQGEPTRVSRFPNDGFIRITELLREGTTEADIRGTKGINEGKFFFAEDEPTTWADEQEVWVEGYWFWDWCTQKQRVESIDAATKLMTLVGPDHEYGYRVGQWFYAFNILRELDAPGEYYIDRLRNKLYFYPPTNDWKDGDFILSQLPSVIAFKNIANISVSGFDILGSRSTAITGMSCENVALSDLNISNCGGSGVYMDGAVNCSVSCCELWNLGSSGITLSGGDRKTLTPAHNEIVENYIHDYARIQRVYAPGATTNGVGNRIAHNLVENAPHMGMGFSGNDQLIEYNEIANVCFESNDAGAIYTGRNWTMRGNVLRGNYLHDINGFEGRGCVGIYLDDMFSSASIEGNLFVNVTRAAFIGGGRDSQIVDNVFINCHPSVHIDARALGWCADHAEGWIKEAKKNGTISGIAYDQEPYRSRYPELANIFAEGNTPKAPEGNRVSGNICVGGTWDVNKQGQWQGPSIEPLARDYITVGENYVADEGTDPGFVDATNGNYRLKADSALLSQGYKSLSSETFGLSNERMKAKAAAWRAKKNAK